MHWKSTEESITRSCGDIIRIPLYVNLYISFYNIIADYKKQKS